MFHAQKKSQLQNLSTQEIPTFFSIPQKNPTPALNCAYGIFIVDEKYDTQKNPVFLSRPKQIPVSFMGTKIPF